MNSVTTLQDKYISKRHDIAVRRMPFKQELKAITDARNELHEAIAGAGFNGKQTRLMVQDAVDMYELQALCLQ